MVELPDDLIEQARRICAHFGATAQHNVDYVSAELERVRAEADEHYAHADNADLADALRQAADLRAKLRTVRAEAVAAERQRILEDLHEQAQLLPVEEAQRVSTWLARAAGSVPVATPAPDREQLARWMLNTVDPTLPGEEVRQLCVDVVRTGMPIAAAPVATPPTCGHVNWRGEGGHWLPAGHPMDDPEWCPGPGRPPGQIWSEQAQDWVDPRSGPVATPTEPGPRSMDDRLTAYLQARGIELAAGCLIDQAAYVDEEARELVEAAEANDRQAARLELADVAHALIGTARKLGTTVEACMDEKLEADQGRGKARAKARTSASEASPVPAEQPPPCEHGFRGRHWVENPIFGSCGVGHWCPGPAEQPEER